MTKPGIIYFLLSLVFIAGCDSLYLPIYFENTASEPIDIEVLRPADTTINQSIKKVLVFTKPGLVPKITVMEGIKRFPNNFSFDKIPDIEFHAMADLLSGSPRFTIMEPTVAIKPAKGKFYNQDEIDTICANAGVDACLFLSSQNVFLGLKAAINTYSNLENPPRGYIWVLSLYEFYSPKEHLEISKEVLTGVEFQTELYDQLDIFEDMDELESLVSGYAGENGGKFANWLAPLWHHDSRNYYITGNKELESVKVLITAEKWDEVYTIWRKFTHDEHTVTAKHASYNTIISFEMEGKLDSALYWAKNAYTRFKSEDLVDYALILEERIRENEVVNKQLGIPQKNNP